MKKTLFIFLVISSFIFSQVEVGIRAIDKVSANIDIKDVDAFGNVPEYYQIEFYISNPDNDVAGFQFTLIPNEGIKIDQRNIYGGYKDKGFEVYSGKNGTILGFSLKGDVIPKSNDPHILFIAKADIDYDSLSEIHASNLVIASKQGETVSATFMPFQFSNKK